MTTKHTFEIRQGATWAWELSNFQEDISDDTFKMQIRAEPNRDSALILDVTPYMSVSEDKLVVSVPASLTASTSFDFDTAYYDLFWEDVALLYGCVNLSKQVTDTRE